MKAKIDYTLERNIRIERKRMAEKQCKSWALYYDHITGEYFSRPNLTPKQIKATALPSNGNGQSIIINL